MVRNSVSGMLDTERNKDMFRDRVGVMDGVRDGQRSRELHEPKSLFFHLKKIVIH